jgi:hypothetical protein
MLNWLQYYIPRINILGAEKIILLDNASDVALMDQLKAEINHHPLVEIHRYDEHIPRKSFLEYGYVWRAIWEFKNIPYEKIVYMDNDFYLFTDKIFDYIRNLDSGWTCFWCPKYGFAETACNILVKGYTPYDKFVSGPWEPHNGTYMEKVLPTSSREKQFIGDRYSEYPMDVPENADYAAQVNPGDL